MTISSHYKINTLYDRFEGTQHGKISMRANTLKNIKISKQKFASGKFTAERFAQSQKDLQEY